MTDQGVLFVDTEITDPELSLKVFDKWYNDVHIAHVMGMSGMAHAVRYVDINKDAFLPHLAIYTPKKEAWLHSDEFATCTESLTSDELPKYHISESIACELRGYKLVEEAKGTAERQGAPNFVIVTKFPSDEGSAVLNKLNSLSSSPGLRRAAHYYLHDDQPGWFQAQWEAEGWRHRHVLIQEFDDSQTKERLSEIAHGLDAAEKQEGHASAESRVYRMRFQFD